MRFDMSLEQNDTTLRFHKAKATDTSVNTNCTSAAVAEISEDLVSDFAQLPLRSQAQQLRVKISLSALLLVLGQ